MTWVRFEDGYPINRKVEALSDAAFRLDVSAICWSNRELTDGVVRARELTQAHRKARPRHAAELVAAGRWHRAEADCPSRMCPANPDAPAPAPPDADGWIIHDYFDDQPTRAKVLADRAAKAERQRNWMAKRRTNGASIDTSTGTARGTPTGSATGGVTGARPVPAPAPAPEGKREGDLPEAPAARRQAADAAGDGQSDDQNLAAAAEPYLNGRPAEHPPDLTGLRATLATARAKARRTDRGAALAELRDATPDIAPLLEPDPEVPDAS